MTGDGASIGQNAKVATELLLLKLTLGIDGRPLELFMKMGNVTVRCLSAFVDQYRQGIGHWWAHRLEDIIRAYRVNQDRGVFLLFVGST